MTGLLLSILSTISFLIPPVEAQNIIAHTTIVYNAPIQSGYISFYTENRKFISMHLEYTKSNVENTYLVLHELSHYLCIKYKNNYTEQCAWKYGRMIEDLYFYPYY